MTPEERVRIDLLEDGAAHEPEVAVHVAQAQAEHGPHERVVEPADDACGAAGRSGAIL